MLKIVVAGGREFNDYLLLEKELDSIFKQYHDDITIISGAARGADTLAVAYAVRHSMNFIKMPADWDTYGKSAGYRRNEDMAKFSDVVVAFWDGKSKGTKHMIDIAKSRNMPLHIVRYGDNL